MWKTMWSLLRKLKIELPYDPAILLLGIFQKTNKKKGINSKRYLYPMFIAMLFIIVKICKQPKCPSTEEWIKKF